MNNTVNRKIPLGELYARTFKVFKENFKTIILVHLVAFVPYYMIYFFIDEFKNHSAIKFPFDIIESFIAVFTGIAYVATAYIVDNSLNGNPPMTFGRSINLAYKKWGTSIASGILMYIIVFLLILLLVIPGLIWMVYYIFFYQVIALTDLSGKRALDYSKYLVRGYWWEVLGNLLALASIPYALYFFGLYKPYRYLLESNPELKILIIPLYTILIIFFSFSVVGITILFRNLENVKSESSNGMNFYEKINKFANHNVDPKPQDENDEADNEVNGEDENALRCSICGIKAEPGQLICPVCRSVIRYDRSHENDDITFSGTENKGD